MITSFNYLRRPVKVIGIGLSVLYMFLFLMKNVKISIFDKPKFFGMAYNHYHKLFENDFIKPNFLKKIAYFLLIIHVAVW